MSDTLLPEDGELQLDLLMLCGAPIRTRAEIFAAIERYRDVVSQLGHSLAERYGFTYPTELEEMTRREWAAFLAVVGG